MARARTLDSKPPEPAGSIPLRALIRGLRMDARAQMGVVQLAAIAASLGLLLMDGTTLQGPGNLGFSIVIVLALYLFFKWTKTGMAMRATAQSQTAARLMGVSVKQIFSLTWAISAGIGAGIRAEAAPPAPPPVPAMPSPNPAPMAVSDDPMVGRDAELERLLDGIAIANQIRAELRPVLDRFAAHAGRPAGREHVRGGGDHGRQRARPRLRGGNRHDHRQRLRTHRGRGGRQACAQLTRRPTRRLPKPPCAKRGV